MGSDVLVLINIIIHTIVITITINNTYIIKEIRGLYMYIMHLNSDNFVQVLNVNTCFN